MSGSWIYEFGDWEGVQAGGVSLRVMSKWMEFLGRGWGKEETSSLQR